MSKTSLFGMDITYDLVSGKLITNSPDVQWEDYSRKYSDKMIGLLSDIKYNKTDEKYYDFYKAIGENSKKEEFLKKNLRYDSTVIFSGLAGNEYKKTAGHFHLPIKGKEYSYPELYQVIKGKALFIMQRVDNYLKTEEPMVVKDLILAEVNAGNSIVIPPNYGHATINIGDETMIFSNLVSTESINFYESVRSSKGMSVFILKEKKGYTIKKNNNYLFDCEPKIVLTSNDKDLGIWKDKPIYSSFLKNPDTFEYLNNPKDFEYKFFDMMVEKS